MTVQNAIDHLKNADARLRVVIGNYPPPSLNAHTNYYQSLVESIIGQQLSVKAAAAIRDRFVAHFDGVFPTPEQIVVVDIESYRTVGLSRQKAAYIVDLANHVLNGSVTFTTLDAMTNQQIIDTLTKVKGIGVWTVHMFLMFCMGRLDVLPVGDLGIRNAVAALYGYETIASPEQVKEIADQNNWHPYESVASYYLWQSLENAPAIS